MFPQKYLDTCEIYNPWDSSLGNAGMPLGTSAEEIVHMPEEKFNESNYLKQIHIYRTCSFWGPRSLGLRALLS